MRCWHFVVITLALSLTTLSGLYGCNSKKPDEDDYFPLNKGLSWKYSYQLISADNQENGYYNVTNLGETEVDNQTITVRRTDAGRDYYLLKKPDGVYRYASRTLFEKYPVTDKPERLVLPLPFSGDTSRRWSSTTSSYIINRTSPSTITTEPPENFVMTYRISSLDNTVTVPAGRFENCLLAEGEATLTMFADPLTGYTDVPIRTREWYAPGVGLIKLERTEQLDTRMYKGGKYTFELISFNERSTINNYLNFLFNKFRLD